MGFKLYDLQKAEEKRKKDLASKLQESDSKYAGIFFYKSRFCIVKGSLWFRKKAGESVVKCVEERMNKYQKNINLFIDCPRYFQIDSTKEYQKVSSTELTTLLNKLVADGFMIFINTNSYLKNILADMEYVIQVELSEWESEREETYEMINQMISDKKIRCKSKNFTISNPEHLDSLAICMKNIAPVIALKRIDIISFLGIVQSVNGVY